MTLSRLPSGRWRARVWSDGRDIPVAPVLGLPKGTTWATKREAKNAREKARLLLQGHQYGQTTVSEWWDRWTSDPMFSRPKESTNIHNRERTKQFKAQYGSLEVAKVSRATVGEWRAGGKHEGTIPALRAMWNDAVRQELTDRNPFAQLGISKTRGNKDKRPPSQEVVWDLIRAAKKLSGPSFAAWLQVAAFTGMRPGELDALKWDAIDMDRNYILVAEQFSAGSRTFTLPKNGKRRYAPLTPPAREALLGYTSGSEFCFINLRGEHWTASSRAYHWRSVAAAVGYEGSLYLATRHAAGSYMVNTLNLSSEDVAIALGHEDGGALVKNLYGHRDKDLALGRVLAAFETHANVVPMPRRQEESA